MFPAAVQEFKMVAVKAKGLFPHRKGESMMKREKSSGRRQRVFLLLLDVVMAAVWMPAAVAQAASVKTQNKKADRLYEKKLTSLRKTTSYVTCKWVDLTGDGVHEGIYLYQGRVGGTTEKIDIYTCKSGKLKRILAEEKYGTSKMIVYRKSGSLVIYNAGHGGETYTYYTLKKGVYKLLAFRSRTAVAGGSESNGAWKYYNAKAAAITKAKFNKAISGAVKGSKTTLKVSNWKTWD